MFKFFKVAKLWVLAVPALAFFLGAGLNQAVLIANHDKFPVMVNDHVLANHPDRPKDGMLDDVHCVMTKDTRLNYFGDIFDLGPDGYVSVGDGLLYAGSVSWDFAPYLWGYLLALELYRKKKEE